MKTVPLISLQVRRDPMTLLPATVAEHELRILRTVHGRDNVYPSEEAAGSMELNPDAEVERLVGKYGEAAVVAAYGEGYDEAIPEAISRIEAPAKAKAKAAATA